MREPVLEESEAWLQDFVLPLNLCPFARRPLVTHRETEFELSYVPPTKTLAELLEELHTRSERILLHAKATEIIVCPHPELESFGSFMDFVNNHVSTLPPLSKGLVQCAPFHPSFQFDSVPFESVENEVNRSPYPMFHLLQEGEVEMAIEKWREKGGNTEDIWMRNTSLLNWLGKAGVESFKNDNPKPISLLNEINKFDVSN